MRLALKEMTKRIQPYSALDGEYINLVEFVLEAVQHLDESFRPAQVWSERICEQAIQESETTTFAYGEEPVQIRVMHRISFEPDTLDHTEDEVLVSCNGLPENMHLEMQALRTHPHDRFLEIRVTGPEAATNIILESYQSRFGGEGIPDDSGLLMYLRTAKTAATLNAWRAAEFNAQRVLEHEPNNPEALMYLGIARAAQGFEPEGENQILASITLDPRNAVAYYHLGRVVLRQGRCLLASNAFKQGLAIEPTNHPLLYHLGKALECLGSPEEAISYYQQALQNRPGRSLISSFSGTDFTSEATEAINRIRQTVERQ
jgi:hypothetical protein